MKFHPFSKGVANFKFIFLCHFSTNFERFGAYPAAFVLNFPKHTNFFPFWWISEELWPLFSRSPFFLTHPVCIPTKLHILIENCVIASCHHVLILFKRYFFSSKFWIFTFFLKNFVDLMSLINAERVILLYYSANSNAYI